MQYIIEHLDEDLFDWSKIEYEHAASIVGKDNFVVTNVKREKQSELSSFATVHEKKIKDLNIKNACILDPYAEQLLTPEDAKKFDYMIFGGILGNNPAEKRTAQLTNHLPFSTRNLGPHQLSTDTAVYVTDKILTGTPFEKIHFVQEVEVQVADGESYVLPFHYVLEGKKPVISPKLIDYIKNSEGF